MLSTCYYDTAGIREMYRYIQTIDITSITLYRNKHYFAITDIVIPRDHYIREILQQIKIVVSRIWAQNDKWVRDDHKAVQLSLVYCKHGTYVHLEKLTTEQRTYNSHNTAPHSPRTISAYKFPTQKRHKSQGIRNFSSFYHSTYKIYKLNLYY